MSELHMKERERYAFLPSLGSRFVFSFFPSFFSLVCFLFSFLSAHSLSVVLCICVFCSTRLPPSFVPGSMCCVYLHCFCCCSVWRLSPFSSTPFSTVQILSLLSCVVLCCVELCLPSLSHSHSHSFFCVYAKPASAYAHLSLLESNLIFPVHFSSVQLCSTVLFLLLVRSSVAVSLSSFSCTVEHFLFFVFSSAVSTASWLISTKHIDMLTSLVVYRLHWTCGQMFRCSAHYNYGPFNPLTGALLCRSCSILC